MLKRHLRTLILRRAARAFIAVVAGSLATGFPASAAAQDLFVRGGRLIDPEAREIRSANLFIRDGVIVSTPDAPPAGFDGEIVDATGRWIMPGLVDLHTHSFGNMAPVDGAMEFTGTPGTALRMVHVGVTAFLDLFSVEDQIFFMRNTQRENRTPGADIFAAGPCMTAPEGHCSEYGVPTRLMSTPVEARQQVTELAAKDPDVVKIVYAQTGRMPSVDRATMAAAVETAIAHELRTIIHVQSWEDVRHAAEAGATAVTHVPADAVIPDDVLALMVESGIAIIPTMAVQTGMVDLTSGTGLLSSPLLREVASDAVLAAYVSDEMSEQAVRWRSALERERPAVMESLLRMHRAGVPVLTGTDSGNLGTIQGWSMHHEVALLVEAGISTWDALAAATIRPAAFLGLDYGVTPGALANLVIMDRSPVESIRNSESVSDVIHRGVLVDRRPPISR